MRNVPLSLPENLQIIVGLLRIVVAKPMFPRLDDHQDHAISGRRFASLLDANTHLGKRSSSHACCIVAKFGERYASETYLWDTYGSGI
jgi:hypothetical protein